jgi:hypothetical protein
MFREARNVQKPPCDVGFLLRPTVIVRVGLALQSWSEGMLTGLAARLEWVNVPP